MQENVVLQDLTPLFLQDLIPLFDAHGMALFGMATPQAPIHAAPSRAGPHKSNPCGRQPVLG